MGDEQSPATGVEAPAADSQGTAPETATQVVEEQAPVTTTPAVSQATEPDYESLLGNEDVINKLLNHPKAQQRLKSVRQADVDRLANERAEALLRQRDQVYANQRQREDRVREIEESLRAFDEDPAHPIAQRQRPTLERELQQIRAAEARERAATELRPSIEQEAYRTAHHSLISGIGAELAESGLYSEQELGELSPFAEKYVTQGANGFRAWIKDIRKAVAEKEGKALADKMIKERLPVEIQAGVQAELKEQRQRSESPASLPQGAAGESEDQFIARYAAGKALSASDHKKWLGMATRL